MDEATKQAHTFAKVLIQLRGYAARHEYYIFRNHARMHDVPRELLLREFRGGAGFLNSGLGSAM
jgi:hypothetical protein